MFCAWTPTNVLCSNTCKCSVPEHLQTFCAWTPVNVLCLNTCKDSVSEHPQMFCAWTPTNVLCLNTHKCSVHERLQMLCAFLCLWVTVNDNRTALISQAYIQMENWRYLMVRKHFLLHFITDDSMEWVCVLLLLQMLVLVLMSVLELVFCVCLFLFLILQRVCGRERVFWSDLGL